MNLFWPIALGGAAAVAGAHVAHALTLDRRVQYRRAEHASPKVPPALDGYTIAFVTDTHRTRPERLREVAARLRGEAVDLLALGGDFAPAALEESVAILCAEAPRDGVWGVQGNHDDPGRLRRTLAAHGGRLLRNEGVRVREGLYLAGVEDLRTRRPDPPAALAGAGDDFALLLSHSPDVAERCDVRGADLMLCGHTHGGEIALFGLWAPAVYLVTGYGHRFRTGRCRSRAGVPVWVCNGVGRHAPLRVWARPQVLLLTLRRAR